MKKIALTICAAFLACTLSACASGAPASSASGSASVVFDVSDAAASGAASASESAPQPAPEVGDISALVGTRWTSFMGATMDTLDDLGNTDKWQQVSSDSLIINEAGETIYAIGDTSGSFQMCEGADGTYVGTGSLEAVFYLDDEGDLLMVVGDEETGYLTEYFEKKE